MSTCDAQTGPRARGKWDLFDTVSGGVITVLCKSNTDNTHNREEPWGCQHACSSVDLNVPKR